MNSLQKVQVEKMRASGIGFKEISEKINIPVMAGKLRKLFGVLGNDAYRIGEFLRIWLENDASEQDIDIFTARARRMTVEEQEAALESRLAYLHALYRGSIGKIQFDKLRIEAFDMMAYAITHRQNAFLRMVEANLDVFQRVQGSSMLFDRDFYTRIQLNAVTAKNLCECTSGYTISRRGSHLDQLKRRVYTFDEMKMLCDAPVSWSRIPIIWVRASSRRRSCTL